MFRFVFILSFIAVRWREETGADDSLSASQPNVGIIRECYPCYAHGRSKEGELVVYELAGRMRFDRLARAGVTPFDMQVIFFTLDGGGEGIGLTVGSGGHFVGSQVAGEAIQLKFMVMCEDLK